MLTISESEKKNKCIYIIKKRKCTSTKKKSEIA